MNAMVEVGRRIRSLMPEGMSQRDLARKTGLTSDALSRALNGQRGLSPTEVASIARTLGADTHWLITGEADPFAIAVAARHSWDAQRRERVNAGHAEDKTILGTIIVIYRAAYPQGPESSIDIPADPAALRELLGTSFARTFADIAEERLGVDVIRIPGLTTDYSLQIGQRGVIILATQSSWFRSNWSLAHELGHLALNHHSNLNSRPKVQRDELAADRFAAALLLSPEAMAQIAAATTEKGIAKLVWDLGVSTQAVRNQLAQAHIEPADTIAAALKKKTPQLLRDNVAAIRNEPGPDPILAREQSSSVRRMPILLLSALQRQIEVGAASPELLAWALDVPVDDIDFPEPDESAVADAYESMIDDRPTAADWHAMISGASSVG